MFAEGDDGDEVFFVNRGAVRIVFSNRAQERTLQEGSFFGEIALLRKTKRSASIYAVGEVELLVLSAAHANELRAEFPAVNEYFDSLSRQRLSDNEEGLNASVGSIDPSAWMSRLAHRVTEEAAHEVEAPPEFVRALQSRLVSRHFQDGDFLIHIGEHERSMFYLVEGALDFELDDGRTFRSRGGVEQAFFGELALFLEQPRSASVRAVGAVIVLELTLDAAEEVIRMYPEMRKQFVRVSQLRMSKGSRFRPPQWIVALARAVRANFLSATEHPSAAAATASSAANAAAVSVDVGASGGLASPLSSSEPLFSSPFWSLSRSSATESLRQLYDV